MNQIGDENFNTFIKSLSVNDGLLEELYQDDQGYLFDTGQNKYPERLQQLNEQEKEDYIDAWIEKNAKEFWKDEPQFALEYLRELDKADRKISILLLNHYQLTMDYLKNCTKMIKDICSIQVKINILNVCSN